MTNKEREVLLEALNDLGGVCYEYESLIPIEVYLKKHLAQPEQKPLSDEHLISAAPELLEALENWINALDDPSEWMKCRDDAKKAIAKAHGIGEDDE